MRNGLFVYIPIWNIYQLVWEYNEEKVCNMKVKHEAVKTRRGPQCELRCVRCLGVSVSRCLGVGCRVSVSGVSGLSWYGVRGVIVSQCECGSRHTLTMTSIYALVYSGIVV